MSMQLQAELRATAYTVPAAPTWVIRRKCACGGTVGVDGECEECRRKRVGLHRRSSGRSGPEAVPPVVYQALRRPGEPLDPATRELMQARFGHDFSLVRVHADPLAQESAEAVNALAYTVGREVVFGAGRYAPQTAEGRRLLAHELTHVVQQGTPRQAFQGYLTLDRPGDIAEHEADRVGNEVASSIQRQIMPAARTGVVLHRDRRRTTPSPSPEAPMEPTPVAPVLSPIRTVKVWLNAFIPHYVPGKTERAPDPPHAGKTMLRGPIPGISDCYLTDNRDFDSAIHAPSRMHSEIKIDVAGARPTEVFQWHNCDPTHEIDCEDGDAECTRAGDTSRMHFSNLRGSPASTVLVDLEAAANNPCQTGSPDIDYDGTVAINVGARVVAFGGEIDQFPAFEMYATADDGAGAPLFMTMPLPGKDPWNLFGGANRAQDGRTTI